MCQCMQLLSWGSLKAFKETCGSESAQIREAARHFSWCAVSATVAGLRASHCGPHSVRSWQQPWLWCLKRMKKESKKNGSRGTEAWTSSLRRADMSPPVYRSRETPHNRGTRWRTDVRIQERKNKRMSVTGLIWPSHDGMSSPNTLTTVLL